MTAEAKPIVSPESPREKFLKDLAAQRAYIEEQLRESHPLGIVQKKRIENRITTEIANGEGTLSTLAVLLATNHYTSPRFQREVTLLKTGAPIWKEIDEKANMLKDGGGHVLFPDTDRLGSPLVIAVNGAGIIWAAPNRTAYRQNAAILDAKTPEEMLSRMLHPHGKTV